MHECPECGMACDCDIEDTWLDAPDDCSHECEEFDDDDYPDYEPEFIGVELEPGVVAHVSPDVQPETLEALKEMARLLKEQYGGDQNEQSE